MRKALLAVMAAAAATTIPAVDALDGNVETLNEILAQIELPVNTSTLEPWSIPGVVSVTFADYALCEGFGVGDLGFYSRQEANQVADGVELERVDLGFRADNIKFTCTLDATLRTIFSQSALTLRLDSRDASDNFIAPGLTVLSPSFSRSVPTQAFEQIALQQDCFAKARVSDLAVTLDAGSLSSSFLNLLLTYIAQELLEPLNEELCVQLSSVSDALADTIVYGPLAELLAGPEDAKVPLHPESSLETEEPLVDLRTSVLADLAALDLSALAPLGIESFSSNVSSVINAEFDLSPEQQLVVDLALALFQDPAARNDLQALVLETLFGGDLGGGLWVDALGLGDAFSYDNGTLVDIDAAVLLAGLDELVAPAVSLSSIINATTLDLIFDLALNGVSMGGLAEEAITPEFTESLISAVDAALGPNFNASALIDAATLETVLEGLVSNTPVGIEVLASLVSEDFAAALLTTVDNALGPAVNVSNYVNASQLEFIIDSTLIGDLDDLAGSALADIVLSALDERAGSSFNVSDVVDDDALGAALASWALQGSISDETLVALVGPDEAQAILGYLDASFTLLNVSDTLDAAALEAIIDALVVGDTEGALAVVVNNLRFVVPLGELGVLEINATSLDASTFSDVDAAHLGSLEMIGAQTVRLPGIPVGGANFSLVVAFTLTVDTTATILEGAPPTTLSFTLTDAFAFEFSWQDIAVQLAVLLALESETLGAVQLGPFLDQAATCVASALAAPILVDSAVIAKSSAQATLGGAQDALTRLFTDSANIFFRLYTGALPQTVSSYMTTAVQDEVLLPVPPADVCAPFPDTPGARNAMFTLQGAPGLATVLETVLESAADTLLGQEVGIPASLLRQTVGSSSLVALDGVVLEQLDASWGLDATLLDYGPESSQHMTNTLRVGPIRLRAAISVGVDEVTKLGQSQGRGRRRLAGANSLEIVWDADRVDATMALWLTLSEYDVYSMPLAQATSLDCWTSRLAPYGGITALNVSFADVSASLTCITCNDGLLADLGEALQDPNSAAAQDLVRLVTSGKDALLDAIVAQYDEDDWEETVGDADLSCRDLAVSTVEESQDSAEDDLTVAYVYVSVYAVALCSISAMACFPAVSRWRRARHSDLAGLGLPVGNDGAGAVVLQGVAVAAPTEDGSLALWRSAEVPRPLAYAVPALLAVNVVLFGVGHAEDVIRIDIVGELFGGTVDVAYREFAGFSVFSSTQRLWKDGARLLAALLFLLSIVWPYVKIVCMGACWFAPPRFLSEARRGTVLLTLDRLGRWSLLELMFIAVLLVVLEVEVNAPSSLPGVYEIGIEVLPVANLFTFTVGLLLSLALSNAIVVAHERAVDRAWRSRSASSSDDGDADEISVGTAPLRVGEGAKGLSQRMQMALAVCIGTCAILLCVAAAQTAVTLRAEGLVPALAAVGGSPREQHLSLFDVVFAGFQADAASGQAFFALVLALTTFLLPLAQLGFLAFVLARRFTLSAATRVLRALHVISAWCATSVFVLGIALAAFEIGTVSRTLLETECEAVLPTINLLASLDLLAEDDVAAGCYVLRASLQSGAYLLLLFVILHASVHFVVSSALEAFIERRRGEAARLSRTAKIAPP